MCRFLVSSIYSNVSARESYRQISFVEEFCIKTIAGHGFNGYLMAIDDCEYVIKKSFVTSREYSLTNPVFISIMGISKNFGVIHLKKKILILCNY